MQTFISIFISLLINMMLILGLFKLNDQKTVHTPEQLSITTTFNISNIINNPKTPTLQTAGKPVTNITNLIKAVHLAPKIQITPIILPSFSINTIAPTIRLNQIDPVVITTIKHPTQITSASHISSVNDIDAPLTVLHAPNIDYPLGAKRLKRNGLVIVNLLIDKAGMVEEVKIISVTGHYSFEQAVLNKIKQYRFTPPKIDNTPVKVWAKKEFKFRWNQ